MRAVSQSGVPGRARRRSWARSSCTPGSRSSRSPPRRHGRAVRGRGSRAGHWIRAGCSTWPECTPGQLFPSGTVHSLIEFSHRAFVSRLVAQARAAFLAWVVRRDEPRVLWPSIAAFPLVVGQAVLGGIVVATELDPWWVTAHFAVALALVADVVYVAAASVSSPAAAIDRSAAKGFARLTLWSAGVTGALLLVGTYIRAKGPETGLAFQDWPLMDGKLVPTLGGVTTPMFLHRVLALAAFLLVMWVMVRARTMADRSRAVVRSATLWARVLRGADRRWGRERVLAAEALGGRAPRRVRGADLGHGGRARDGRVGARPIGRGRSHRLGGGRDRGGRGHAVGPRHDHGLLPPDEAAHHRPAADHHGAGDDARRRGDALDRG